MPDDDAVLNHDNLDSNSSIKKLALEISHFDAFKNKVNLNQFLEDALCGLYFESNIPFNYGLGSSGALVASIYAKYFSPKNINLENTSQLAMIQHELAAIESYYHGNSSGTDPLISFLNKALFIHTPLKINKLPINNNVKFLLIDTKKQSSTKSFMQVFEKLNNEHPNKLADLIHHNNESIIALLKGDDKCYEIINHFCDLEQELMTEMFVFPLGLANILSSFKGNFNVKLCGSGGGGFLIGICQPDSYNKLSSSFISKNIDFQPIEIPNTEVVNI